MNDVITRRGILVENFEGSSKKVKGKGKQVESFEEKKIQEKEIRSRPPEIVVVKEEKKEAPHVAHSHYKPKVPFPQRLVKAKVETHFLKLIEMMKNLYVNVPFTEFLSQMPNYTKFL